MLFWVRFQQVVFLKAILSLLEVRGTDGWWHATIVLCPTWTRDLTVTCQHLKPLALGAPPRKEHHVSNQSIMLIWYHPASFVPSSHPYSFLSNNNICSSASKSSRVCDTVQCSLWVRQTETAVATGRHRNTSQQVYIQEWGRPSRVTDMLTQTHKQKYECDSRIF